MADSRFSPAPVAGCAAPVPQTCGVGKGCAVQTAFGAAERPLRIPADLAAFIASATARQACAALGCNGGQLRRLRAGRAEALTLRMLGRWAEHQSKNKLPAGPWAVRKVDGLGCLSLGGRRFAALGLGLYAGQRVLVAPLADGSVLVQPIATGGGIQAQPVAEA